MKNQTAYIVGGAIVIVAGIAAYVIVQTKKAAAASGGSGGTGGGSGSSSSSNHAVVQARINEALNDPPTLNAFNHMKVGGAHGVPANSKTAKPYVLGWVLDHWHLSTNEDASAFSYPGLITDESAGDGLERDDTGSDFDIGSIAGGIIGFAAGGPGGAAAGGALGGLFGRVSGTAGTGVTGATEQRGLVNRFSLS